MVVVVRLTVGRGSEGDGRRWKATVTGVVVMGGDGVDGRSW